MDICSGVVGCCCGCFVKGVVGIVGGVVGLVVDVLWGCCEDIVVQAIGMRSSCYWVVGLVDGLLLGCCGCVAGVVVVMLRSFLKKLWWGGNSCGWFACRCCCS